jgi:hypothetical protein
VQSSTPPVSSTTFPPTTDNGSTVKLAISGNITTAQISNVTITTNQSNNSTTISFTVTGEPGTWGFGNITIPKSAVLSGTTPTIYIDGQPALIQGYGQDGDNYYVWFTTHFSTHKISIVFTKTSSSPNPTISSSRTSAQSSSLFEVIVGVAGGLATAATLLVVLKLMTKTRTEKRGLPEL